MGFVDKLRGKKQTKSILVVLHLNARLQPTHRGELFEDLFDEVLSKYRAGEVTGGGTLQMPTGEIKSCDVELQIQEDRVDNFITFLNHIDIIPKGSKLILNEDEKEIGCAEGMALYLNGTELDAEVYRKCDVNELIERLDAALEGTGQRLSHWEGREETALYFYGSSYAEMQNKIVAIVEEHPLCEKCRVKQIA